MSGRSEKLVEKGEKLFGKGSYHKALKAFREATRVDPLDKFAWNNRGVVLEEFGKLDDAIKCYEAALKIDKKFNLAWTNKGYAKAQQGDFKEAVKCYRKALKANPDDEVARDRLKQTVKLLTEIGQEEK